MAIGNKLKALLKKKKMKVTTLATMTNIPEQTLYAIIRRDSANVDWSILRKICTAAEINVSYFYSGHTNVQSNSDSSVAADYIVFSAIDLPRTEPNEKHYDIATNNIVLSILENLAEEQGCSTTDIIENILIEQLKNYAIENEMTIITDEDIAEDGVPGDANSGIEDTDSHSIDDNKKTNTRDTDLPYWMF